jgi:hypothetical protein
MVKRRLIFILLLFYNLTLCYGQFFINTSDLFPDTLQKSGSGVLKIIQDKAIDTLLSRYILRNKISSEPNGYRVVIYLGRERNSGAEAKKVQAEFMLLYPDILSYIEFQKPNTYLVKVGNFRTKLEGTKLFMQLRKKYPDAFLGKTRIDFSNLTNN